MSAQYKSKAFLRARILRRNPTTAEARLWARLRSHRLAGAGFRRQHLLGPYIVDFCAPRKKVIVELDGEGRRFQQEYDSDRTAFLHEQGYKVLRFWNDDVMRNIEGVLKIIRDPIESGMDK